MIKPAGRSYKGGDVPGIVIDRTPEASTVSVDREDGAERLLAAVVTVSDGDRTKSGTAPLPSYSDRKGSPH
ncbi:hypothetical protein J6590_048325 [Homalodisca vitripennis]|nr:hypothetical protein J6590_048325 [Homalodisca vitripennis]